MAKTSIEWTDYSWPVINGCRRKSAGCVNCYAERLASTRLRHTERYKGLATYSEHGPRWTGESRLDRIELAKPLSWKSPRRIFVCDMGDLFYEGNSFEQIAAVYGVIAACPHHTFQILTKRAERMVEFYEWCEKRGTDGLSMFPDDPSDWRIRQMLNVAVRRNGANMSKHQNHGGPWPLPNLHLGVSVENQDATDRIEKLLRCPAAVRWVSAEPLLGSIDLTDVTSWSDTGREQWDTLRREYDDELGRDGPRLDWVVVGGESGPDARPMHPDWARSLRDQCRSAGVPFFFKQMSGPNPGIPGPKDLECCKERPRA